MAPPDIPSPQHQTELETPPSEPGAPDQAELAASLTHVIFGGAQELAYQQKIRDTVAAFGDVAGTGITQTQAARDSYQLLGRAVEALGGSSRAIAADLRASYALFDWSAALAPRLTVLLSGHLKLTVAALGELGEKSRFQQARLAELDTAATTGVAMITELGHGTDAMHLETTATWQPQHRSFRLDSPTPGSVKFMPNVAADDVAKTVTILARLVVDGRDEGVWPFLMVLRTADRVSDGVEIRALPDAGFGLWMDHALTRFDGALLPESALLGGDVAHFDTNGRFHCELTAAERFARTMSPLHSARLCMSGAAVAAARAGLALTISYATRRRIGPNDRPMISADHVARHLAHAMADVWAMTCLVNAVREQCARPDADTAQIALWGMLVKPAATHTAWQSLEICRQRSAAQGMLRANLLVDYIAVCQGIMTAEGENWAMLGAAGRATHRSGVPRLNRRPGRPARKWWHRLLTERQSLLSAGVDTGSEPDCAAVELATAITDLAAVEAMIAAAEAASVPTTSQILSNLAAVYALRRISADAVWFTANGLLPETRAVTLECELRTRTKVLARYLPVLARSFALPDDLPAPMAGDYITRWTQFARWRTGWQPDTTAPATSRPARTGR